MAGGGRFNVAGVAAILLVASVLAGCSSTDSSSGSVTLAQTKSPVQLLRDETASRIPSAAVGAVSKTEDKSISCKAKAKDPEGKSRKWKSSTLLEIEAGSAWRTAAMVDDVVASFVEDGWEASDSVGTGVKVKILKSKTSAAQIQLSTKEAESKKDIAKIQVTVTGACVETGGADSPEVMELEKRKS